MLCCKHDPLVSSRHQFLDYLLAHSLCVFVFTMSTCSCNSRSCIRVLTFARVWAYLCVCEWIQDEWFFSGTYPLLKAIVFSEDSDTSLVWCVDVE